MNIAAIILNFNNQNTLHKSVNGALTQSKPFDEIIIVEDASDDHSFEEICKLTAGMSNIKVCRHQHNKGVNQAIITGLTHAKSEYVYLMSAQHEYSRNIVAIFHELISETPNAVMVSGNIAVANKFNVLTEYCLPFDSSMRTLSPDFINKIASRRIFTFFGGGNIVHRKTVLSLSLFHQQMKWHADWYMYQLLGLMGPVAISPEIFTTHPFKKNRYSDGMFDSKMQWPVTKFFIEYTRLSFPEHYKSFKRNAVLPLYGTQTLLKIVFDNSTREYVSAKLIVRSILFWPSRRIASFIPNKLKNKFRSLIRL